MARIREMFRPNNKQLGATAEKIMTDESSSSSSSSLSRQSADKSSQHESSSASSSPLPHHHHHESTEPLTPDSVYAFYAQHIFPAVVASLPILWNRLTTDTTAWLGRSSKKALDFVLPAWITSIDHYQGERWAMSAPTNLVELWQTALESSANHTGSMADFMLKYFDTNGDGHISPSELLNMTEIVSRFQSPQHVTFWAWFSREWPLMDWKLGVFLWRSFGGLLLVMALLSIMPGRLHSWSGKILRWPILIVTLFLIIVELMVYIVIRVVIRIAEVLIASPKHRALRRKMASAESYETWYQYAAALDISQKRDKWQRTVKDHTSYRYNWALIRHLMDDMRSARVKHDVFLAQAILQQCTRKNVGGIMSEDLFSYTNTGEPKYMVKEFVEEVTKTMIWITDESLRMPESNMGPSEAEAKKTYVHNLERKVRNEKDKLWKGVLEWAMLSFGAEGAEAQAHNNKSPPPKQVSIGRPRISSDHTHGSDGTSNASEGVPKALPHFHKEELIAFLKRARSAYGRTALCLSGGAMMGMYHFGHLQGLMETDCLPHIVSGTSAGAVVAAIVCTRTNEELRRDLRPEVAGPKMKCFARSWSERLKSVWKNGRMFSGEEWLDMIQWFTCGNMTFEEAYKKTGRIYCITLASTTKKAPPVLINYTTAPNVTIASAVIASAAVPGFISPVRLQVKDPDGTVRSAGDETYFDGSIEHDIPVNGLAEQLNCQFFVAAQCNPHVVPFFFNAKGGVGSPSRWRSGEQDASWRGGFLLAALEMYLKNDMKAKFRFLNEMEVAVGFTGTMMAQEHVGSTTIVPQVELWDFFKVSSHDSNPIQYHTMQ
jgi:predicted acylesterase/phospholipase RssA